MPRIFISYRRTDSKAITSRIYDRLVAVFGKKDVFKDVDSIGAGRDFRGVIREAAAECRVMLVIIGPNWVSATDANGNRRLDNPDDFVRIEVETGLQRDSVLVIPLLVEGASMPLSNQLPASLQQLAYKNAFTIHDDPLFHHDMWRLIYRLLTFFWWPKRIVAIVVSMVGLMIFLSTLPPQTLNSTPEVSSTISSNPSMVSSPEIELTLNAYSNKILQEIRQTQNMAATTTAGVQTATASAWTHTPTLDIHKTAEARVTQDARQTQTQNAVNTSISVGETQTLINTLVQNVNFNPSGETIIFELVPSQIANIAEIRVEIIFLDTNAVVASFNPAIEQTMEFDVSNLTYGARYIIRIFVTTKTGNSISSEVPLPPFLENHTLSLPIHPTQTFTLTFTAGSTLTATPTPTSTYTNTLTPMVFEARIRSEFAEIPFIVRSMPSNDAFLTGGFANYTKMTVYATVAGEYIYSNNIWYLVLVQNGLSEALGYIHSSFVELIPPSNNPNATPSLMTLTPTPIVLAAQARASEDIRSSPSSIAFSKGRVPVGVSVPVYAQIQGIDGNIWYFIQYGTLSGYVRSVVFDFVSLDNNLTARPPFVTLTPTPIP